MRTWILVLCATLVLAGCGGGGEDPTWGAVDIVPQNVPSRGDGPPYAVPHYEIIYAP